MARNRSRSIRSQRQSRRRRSSSDRASRGRSRSKRQGRYCDSPSQKRTPPRRPRQREKTGAWVNRYAPEVPEDVRSRVIVKLEEAGYTFDWQVSILPRVVLLHLFPSSSHGLELTAVLHAQRMAEPSQKEGGLAVVEQFERMIAQQKKHTKVAKQSRRMHNNDAVSSSESADDIGFDATECLKK